MRERDLAFVKTSVVLEIAPAAQLMHSGNLPCARGGGGILYYASLLISCMKGIVGMIRGPCKINNSLFK